MTSHRTGPTARSIPQFQFAVVSGIVHGPIVTGASHDGVPVCSFDVAVADDAGRTLVPVTWRDAPRDAWCEGAAVVVRGRVEKRFHRQGGRTVARTSLEAAEIVVAPRPAALGKLLARAGAEAPPHQPG